VEEVAHPEELLVRSSLGSSVRARVFEWRAYPENQTDSSTTNSGPRFTFSIAILGPVGALARASIS
jgi:hypothetical protein